MYSGKLGRGIYSITNTINGKMYIGMAMDIWDRLNGHKWDLNNNIHGNLHLQRSVNRDGINNFSFEVLWECEEEYLCSEENYWCNLLNVHDRRYGYNIRPTSPEGRTRLSAESRERMRQSGLKRAPVSEITREKHRQRGLRKTPEELQKMIETLKNSSRKTRGVICLSIEGEYIREFSSVKETSKIMNLKSSTLNCTLMGIQSSCKGHIYVHKDKYDPSKLYTGRVKKRIVYKYDNDWNKITEYPSVKKAADDNNIDQHIIAGECRRYEGWKNSVPRRKKIKEFHYRYKTVKYANNTKTSK